MSCAVGPLLKHLFAQNTTSYSTKQQSVTQNTSSLQKVKQIFMDCYAFIKACHVRLRKYCSLSGRRAARCVVMGECFVTLADVTRGG